MTKFIMNACIVVAIILMILPMQALFTTNFPHFRLSPVQYYELVTGMGLGGIFTGIHFLFIEPTKVFLMKIVSWMYFVGGILVLIIDLMIFFG